MPRILSTCQEGVSSVTTHTQGAYNVTDAVFPILWDKPENSKHNGRFLLGKIFNQGRKIWSCVRFELLAFKYVKATKMYVVVDKIWKASFGKNQIRVQLFYPY